MKVKTRSAKKTSPKKPLVAPRKPPLIPKKKGVKPWTNSAELKRILKDRGLTYRSLAALMGISAPSVNQLIAAKRRSQYDEVVLFSELVGLPPKEVFPLFGKDVESLNLFEEEAPGSVPVAGTLDGALVAQLEDAANGKTTPSPFGVGRGQRGVAALRFRTAGSSFLGLDGAVLFLAGDPGRGGQAGGGGAPEIGRLCLVKVAGKANWRLRVVLRGETAGKYHLTDLANQRMEDDVFVETAIGVIGMRF